MTAPPIAAIDSQYSEFAEGPKRAGKE
jgi:hypothetical protein